MNRKPDALALSQANDLLIIELDDRLEMAAAVVAADSNTACNGSTCSQNGYCPKPTK